MDLLHPGRASHPPLNHSFQEMNLSRRDFIKKSAIAASTMSTAQSWSQVSGANQDIRVGVIGFRSKGRTHIADMLKIPGVRVVALCDVDTAILEREAEIFRKRGVPITTYTDVRRLIASNEVDVVTTATPNHWHGLITVWACQAGKDVYVEKPVSHNVWEGRQMVRAARKYNRIVQSGTQNRSDTAIIAAAKWVKEGHLGRVKFARGLCYKPRPNIGKVSGPQKIPAGIDYDLWCGPAPAGPLMREQLHYDWHWVWDTGNGDLGNQGIHQMDIARWFLGEKGLARMALS